MGKKKVVIMFVIMGTLFASCKHSLFQVLTQNNCGYWSRYWTPNKPDGLIAEYSKKDSLNKFLNEDLSYDSFVISLGDIYGVRFKIKNDTIFHYVKTRRGFIQMYDTVIVESFSKDTIKLKNGVVWHRISKRIIKKRQKLLKRN